MKKKIITIVSLIMAVLMLTAIFGCSNDAESESGESAVSSSDIAVSEADVQNKPYISQLVTYQIDIDYANEWNQQYSNYDKNFVTEKYAEKWHALIDEYYQLIIDSELIESMQKYPELVEWHNQCKQYIIESQEQWQVYYQQQTETHRKYIETYYNTGSAAPAGIVVFEYEMYRSRAIQLYEFCQDLFIDCERP